MQRIGQTGGGGTTSSTCSGGHSVQRLGQTGGGGGGNNNQLEAFCATVTGSARGQWGREGSGIHLHSALFRNGRPFVNKTGHLAHTTGNCERPAGCDIH